MSTPIKVPINRGTDLREAKVSQSRKMAATLGDGARGKIRGASAYLARLAPGAFTLTRKPSKHSGGHHERKARNQ